MGYIQEGSKQGDRCQKGVMHHAVSIQSVKTPSQQGRYRESIQSQSGWFGDVHQSFLKVELEGGGWQRTCV